MNAKLSIDTVFFCVFGPSARDPLRRSESARRHGLEVRFAASRKPLPLR